MDVPPAAETPRRKLQRISQACDFCHRRGLKCVPPSAGPITLDGPQTPAGCLTCAKHGQKCTRLRKPKRRGAKPRQRREDGTLAEDQLDFGLGREVPLVEQEPWPRQPLGSGTSSKPPPRRGSASFMSRENISTLIRIYLDSIYPLYPFFCETELLVWWNGETEPEADTPYYTSVLCMCALTALQANKGSLFTNELESVPSTRLAESFLAEALRRTPLTYREGGGGIDLLRCYGILALAGTQAGDCELLHRYLGLYQGLVAQLGLHNEDRWPPTLSPCEKEARRRLFWVVYRIEVHNACVLGHPIRTPETQTYVHYPCGVHHAPNPSLFPDRNGLFENWMAGWNYTTELYRILEHAIIDFRSKRTSHTSVLRGAGGGGGEGGAASTAVSIFQKLEEMQSNLMPQFAQAAMKSSDSGSNRCGFQVANILCTIHLVKMVVLASEDVRFREICQTVQDLVGSMGTVPRDYIRAFGTPLMQELVGVGFMLTSVTARNQNLSDPEYGRLKDIMHVKNVLAGFIDELGDCIGSASNAAFCLRSSLSRIDQAVSRRVENESPRSSRGGWASLSNEEAEIPPTMTAATDDAGWPVDLFPSELTDIWLASSTLDSPLL